MPTQARKKIRTKVDGLTPFNVRELAKLDNWATAGTYAIYNGSPKEASNSVEAALRDAIVALGGRSTEYRSLIAVKNKLVKHLMDGGHRNVLEMVNDNETPAKQGDSKPPRKGSTITGQYGFTRTIHNARIPDDVWEAAKARAKRDGGNLTELWIDALSKYATDGGFKIGGRGGVVGEQPLFGADK